MKFVRDAIESAENYYNSANTMKHSRDSIAVTGISVLTPELCRLDLSQKIKMHPESVKLCINSHLIPDELYDDPDNRYLSTKYYRIVKSEDNPPSVTVMITDELKDIFPKLSPKNILLVSDLKFLIKNVWKWYAEYGHHIKFPSTPSISNDEIYRRGYESDEQLSATTTIFSSPISYVWGAPGTGKTQIVLANAVMTYVRQKKQVIILAPTNNALDQTLFALIKAMNKEEQDTCVIYRLGTATGEFARHHSNLCERLDKQERLEELRQQKTALEKKNEYQINVQRMLSDCDSFVLLKETHEKLSTKLSEHNELRNQLDIMYRVSDKQFQSYKTTLSQIATDEARIQKRESSVSFKIKRIFTKSEQMQLTSEKESLALRRADCNSKLAKLENELETLRRSIKETKDTINRTTENIQENLTSAKRIVSEYADFENWEQAAEYLEDFATPLRDIKIDESIPLSLKELEVEINALKDEAAVRTKGKLVYACTVDYLFAHYKSLAETGISSALISHVFLDEAAYCPFIKAGILYSFGTPVTLLGDHMQLPPICEATDKDIHNKDTKFYLWSLSAIRTPDIFNDTSYNALFYKLDDETSALPNELSIAVLPHTFRFGNNLAEILDEYVYKNGFSGNEDFDTDITVLHARRSARDNELRANTAEALAIKEYIISNNIKNCVVMTPYKVQRKILLSTLRGILDPDNILTIHSSQGREWDTVIISVADTNQMFLTNSKLPQGLCAINTAISRAKKNIVIACDSDYWKSKSSTQLIGRLVHDSNNK